MRRVLLQSVSESNVMLLQLVNIHTHNTYNQCSFAGMHVSEFGCDAIAWVAIATPGGDNTDHLYKH